MDDKTADECGICLETLTAAITLPCTHKFCADCLHGWKSKFGAPKTGSYRKEEKSKSCPLCRERIPPSKEMIIQLQHSRQIKRGRESVGDTSSELYTGAVRDIKAMEEEIGDYEGEGLDYDVVKCMEIPGNIYKAVEYNDMKKVMDWLGSPVDMKRLSARYPDRYNFTHVHLAVDFENSDLLSMVLQCGANVNALGKTTLYDCYTVIQFYSSPFFLDANGWSPLIIANARRHYGPGHGFPQARLLLEWGVEFTMPESCQLQHQGKTAKFLFISTALGIGNTDLVNLILSEFGGRRCEVINLPNHPQLNGKTCVVERYIAKKDKYKIIFEGSGNAALVGPNNLKRRDRTPLDCGYYISFKNGKMSRLEFAAKEECRAYVSSLHGGAKETAEELARLKL